ncbi:MAG: DEAD/DEAH box helicase, partial [Clostridiales bacterium]|nr:DEAD/DEAH box helicase [Clostridiales bacterium]
MDALNSTPKESTLDNADYAPGMRLIIRDEEWMVKKVETNSFKGKTLYCYGISPLVKNRDSIFIADLENVEKVDPTKLKLVPDDSPYFRKSRLYIESGWRQKIPTDSALHVGNLAAMDVLPYQLEPAQLALRKPRQRILLADSVGLGKTLEAGILLTELIARGKGRRILVVTVKSMMAQFQKELWNRFTIPLIRLDSTKIHRLRSFLPSNYNPFHYYDKTIVSVDTIKRDLEYRTHLEDSQWDIIVIDEAHNVAERGNQAQRSKLANLLSERSDTLIMLSATPHDGRSESFASLMNMLDPTAIANPHDYRKEDIKGLCVRRFKKDIQGQISGTFKDRRVEIERCNASSVEEHAFGIFTEMKLEMDIGKSHLVGTLFKTSLEKSLFSSPAACIKSIDERLKKLRKKYTTADIKDIASLEELKEALENVNEITFSRYRTLLQLLRDKDYAWKQASNDRIVIFTERIETMKFLIVNLRKDLHMRVEEIQELHGSMKDNVIADIVEGFGREDSPIRILVATDVASEGINLHYLCHRLIHFDIPWSLMVFQQRNGRIDRYGQLERPDIRYLMIHSNNEKIKGDTRIMEILVQKEENANKNIGDPTFLMGKFNVEDEELVTADAIENGSDPEDFARLLDDALDAFDPYEALMASGNDEAPTETVDDDTLFSDLNYLKTALEHLSEKESDVVKKLETISGLEIKLTPDMRRRFKALLPDEAIPSSDYMRVTTDKEFAMEEMMRSMQSSISETAWPKTHYLWKLHPVFTWINDKSGLIFGRGEAPLVGLPGTMKPSQIIYIVAGTIPNRKSAPVVDEWFGLLYENDQFSLELTMDELIARTKFGRQELPNRQSVSEAMIASATALLPNVVGKAKEIMQRHVDAYKDRIDPQITDELEKQATLEARHHQFNNDTFAENKRKFEEDKNNFQKKERKITETFQNFVN